jgi:hypothetical protein
MRSKVAAFAMSIALGLFCLGGAFTITLALSGCGGSTGGGTQPPPSKTTPTITWATPASVTYGTAIGSTQLSATASVAGTFVYTPASGAILGVGAQTLSTTFTPTDTTKYTTATATVSLVVNKATPTVSAWPVASAVTSGAALSASTLAGGTASVSGVFAWTTPSAIPAVGTDSESVTFTPTDTTNYTVVIATVQLVVNPVLPTITSYTPRYVVQDNFSNSPVDYTLSCAGCEAGDILHDLNGFPDLVMQSIPTLSFFDLWNGLDYEPQFDTVEIQHPNGAYGNQWGSAFLGSASQSTLAVSATTGTLFHVEQKDGQVYYAKTDGTTGTLFKSGGDVQSAPEIALDDVTGNLAYVLTEGNQISVQNQTGFDLAGLVCHFNPSMSFVSSVAARGGYIVFTDPTDNKVGIAKMDCSGYQTISVAGQPWSVGMDASGNAYVLSRDKGAGAVPTLTKITVATGKVVATLDLPGITPVSTIRAASGYEYAGIYTVAAFASGYANVLFMSDKTDGTVLTINTSTMKIAQATPITNQPYILAAQDGTTPILRVGYFLADSGEAVTHIGNLDPTTGNYTPAVGACPTGLAGGLVATANGVYCSGGSTITPPLVLP